MKDKAPASESFAKPACDFVIPTEYVSEVKSIVRKQQTNVLIGTKNLEDGTTFLTVTLFATSPQSMGQLRSAIELFQDKTALTGKYPAKQSLQELITKVRQKREEC
ncbi:MAG: hypothetical protein HY692_07700 [Cyanobacteria bacterium NC_groundwater_1444_Ag_S-0.65um_54_12]|nr:hypothetical protein [Cyanobacteria bacterium NC_groundwater_1444_Ag_S-0.65um_54_12]